MRKTILAALIASLVTVAFTTEAAQRSRRRAGASRSVFVSKDSPDASRAQALQIAMDRQRTESYRGLSVEPHPKATGDTLELQERMAALLARLDYAPAHRAEHFRWITEQLGMTIVGWRGQIVETAATPGGVRVMVKVQPIAGLGTKDDTLESYLYASGRLIHLGSEGAPTRGVITFN